jgi:hypothetical protein
MLRKGSFILILKAQTGVTINRKNGEHRKLSLILVMAKVMRNINNLIFISY